MQEKKPKKKPHTSLGLSYKLEHDQIKHAINKYLPILCKDEKRAHILDQGVNIVARRALSMGDS